MITARRAARAVRAALPAWLGAVLGACLIIPGPLDEMAALLVVLVLVAVQPRVYAVRFTDGHEGTVWEDELLTGPEHYYRPDYHRRDCT